MNPLGWSVAVCLAALWVFSPDGRVWAADPTASPPDDARAEEAAGPGKETPAAEKAAFRRKPETGIGENGHGKRRHGRSAGSEPPGSPGEAAMRDTLSHLLPPAGSLDFHPVAGQWVRYRLEKRGGIPNRREVWFGIASLEDDGSAWLEIRTESRSGSEVLLRLLYFPPKAGRAAFVKRFQIKNGNHPLVELPPGDEARSGAALPEIHCLKREKETLETEAGRFEADVCLLEQDGTGRRVWSSQAVPIFGVLRAITMDSELHLVAFGSEDRPAAPAESPLFPDEMPARNGASPGGVHP